MADRSRLFDGFTELSRGMDGGRSPTLIAPNQVAAAVNVTFRGAFARTRPPFNSRQFTFPDSVTETRFTGKFQGAMFYEANVPAHIVSRGGRLFRVETNATNLVTEITPRLTIITTEEFTVPALNAQVLVDVVSETPISVGDTVTIDSGSYLVITKLANQLFLEYLGGAANATVDAGAEILDSNGDNYIEVQENSSSLDFVYLFQAENYVIVLAGQNKPTIYDGSSSRQARIGEVPPGVLGIYVWGRVWVVLPDNRSFMAGDLVHSNTLIDASDVLKFTENDFYNEGGTFAVPYNAGPITAMQALATQDTSLGMGALLVGTRNMVFSVNTPVDRTTWKNLTYPIQTVALIDYGPTGPRCGPQVNGDWWYRSSDGHRSFIVARRYIQSWGNTPMSREISPILEFDSDDLLFFSSSILFDNRLLSTTSPHRTDLGIAHRGLTTLNLDLLSNLQGKTTPAWEGAWSGLNILQLTKGDVDRVEKGFAWVERDDELQLWELLKAGYYDQFNESEGGESSITRTAIPCRIETRSVDFQSQFNLKSLRMGELYLEEIVDTVSLVVKFRPDQYPNWVTWAEFEVCANVTQCNVQAPTGFTCSVWKTRQKGYAARILLPKPPETCNTLAGIPVDKGFEFQFRIEWTGNCQIPSFQAHANIVSQPMEGACPPEVSCKTFEACADGYFDYTETGPAMS